MPDAVHGGQGQALATHLDEMDHAVIRPDPAQALRTVRLDQGAVHVTTTSEENRRALMAELNVAAEPRVDHCSGMEPSSAGHYFIKVPLENRWQCVHCPETRERDGS